MFDRLWAIAFACALIAGPAAHAQEVWITEDMPVFEYEQDGQTHVIERNQDQTETIDDSFAKTSRPCPPFCVHAMEAAPGVETVGELELLDFLREKVETGRGLLVDARLASWYDKGTIPGAINLPFPIFTTPDNPFFAPIMQQLGAVRRGRSWDFAEARELLLFCNGPWCDQSPRAIRGLIAAGFPPEKLFYYRGGMQAWLSMGFQTVLPGGV